MSKNKMNQVGIDVSAETLVVELRLGSTGDYKQGEFDNTPEGHRKLEKWITKDGAKAKVCMEATGVYHLKLAMLFSQSKKIELMVVNPKAMKNFSTALLKRAKTDKVDAYVILEYVIRMDFVEWVKPSEKVQELQALVHRVNNLVNERAREKTRLKTNAFRGKGWKLIEKDINGHIVQLTKRIKALEAKIVELISKDQQYQEKQDILKSIKGIGDTSSVQILAQLLLMPVELTPAQMVAYAGLDPKPIESGKSVSKLRKISKAGNKYLRASLFMPAMSAIQHQDNIKAYYEMLLAKGKQKLQAIIAVMRKLLQCICGMLKNKTQWDGNKFYKIQYIA